MRLTSEEKRFLWGQSQGSMNRQKSETSTTQRNTAQSMEKKQPYARQLNICPDCEAPLIPEGGCVYCRFCGWALCG